MNAQSSPRNPTLIQSAIGLIFNRVSADGYGYRQ